MPPATGEIKDKEILKEIKEICINSSNSTGCEENYSKGNTVGKEHDIWVNSLKLR